MPDESRSTRSSSPSDEELTAERLRLAAGVSDIGIWDIDPVADVTFWDARTREILGVPLDGEVDQDMFYTRLHPADRERVTLEVKNAYDPAIGEYFTEYRVGTPNAYRWVRARGRAFFNASGQPVRFIGILLDITDDKERERERERLTAEARRANAAKDQFLAMLGHELRNPLAPILLAVELLGERGEGSRRELSTIERQARYMARLVDDLLDIARIAQAKIELDRRHGLAAEIVRGAIEAVQPEYDKRGQTLRVLAPAEPIELWVDPDRLTQVTSNLLHNASKFSPDDSTIDLRYAIEGEAFVLEVRDRGTGIPCEEIPRLFVPFEQRPQTIERKLGGLGLGLAIVKSLVELHGGTVSAVSDGPDLGSCFRVELPHGEPIASAAPAIPAPTPVAGTRVLIVDDNVDLCAMLAIVLEQRGFTVRTAHDGSDALSLARSFAPQVAFVDIGLPIMSGYQLAGLLREQLDAPPHMVAISGYGQDEDRREAEAVGFAGLLVKPVDTEVFVATIQRLLGETPRT